MLKKLYLLTFLILGFHFLAFPQRTKDMGFRVSLNSPWLVNSNFYNDEGIRYGFSYGYSAGLKAGMDVLYEFGINAELLYTHYGTSFYERIVDPHWSRTFSLNYAELPVMIRYKEDKFYLEAGPQIGYLLNSKDILTNFNQKDIISTDKAKFSMLNYAIVVGSGFMVYEYEKYNLFLGARFSYGFSNVLNEEKFNPLKNLYPYSIFPNYPPPNDPDLTVQNLPVKTFYIGICAEFSWSSSRYR